MRDSSQPSPTHGTAFSARWTSATVVLLSGVVAVGCSGGKTGDPPAGRVVGTDPSGSGRGEPQEPSRTSQPTFSTTASFVDRAHESGIDFVYRNGEEAGNFAILESLGGGAAIFDFDGDARMDLFFPGGGGYEGERVRGRPSALYRNTGDWRFVAVAEPAGVMTAPHYSHGAAVADYDHDGFPDVLVTGYGELTLFRNQGDGTFREVAGEAGLDDRLWSSSAAWGDLDGDGHADLYVAHYVDWSFANHPVCPGPGGKREVCSPRRFEPLPDLLYFSNGDGTFRDGSRDAGLREDGKGLGVIMADVDLDGRLDVYVANDTVGNFLYRNAGGGKLEDRSLMSGTALSAEGTPDGSMGVDLGDYNLDGLPDLWVANYERESFALYRNLGNAMFLHSSQATGVTAVGALYVGWGTAFFDFDHDGDEDVFAATGHVIRYPTSAPLRQNPLLFQNDDGRFHDVAPAAGSYASSPHMGRGIALGDLDDDGDLDLVVSHVNEPVAVLENQSTGERNWLGFRLVGRRSPRDPVGALVSVRVGETKQTRQRKGGGSYASSNDPRLFFGLGAAERVDEIEVRWPSGTVQTLRDVPAGQVLTVVEAARSGGTP